MKYPIGYYGECCNRVSVRWDFQILYLSLLQSRCFHVFISFYHAQHSSLKIVFVLKCYFSAFTAVLTRGLGCLAPGHSRLLPGQAPSLPLTGSVLADGSGDRPAPSAQSTGSASGSALLVLSVAFVTHHSLFLRRSSLFCAGWILLLAL